ncbi:MAG: glycoside hydrolase family 44 protein [Candidatus Uhrbacteria bacterium]|nr:glycoside hydrolase family 44 protein [Candidatus Uhrbacteria bacterium]
MFMPFRVPRVLRRVFGTIIGIAVLAMSSFVLYPESLFAASSSCSLTTGGAYRTASVTTVYVITSDCQKRPIFNPDVYFSYYQDWSPVKFIEQSALDRVPDHALRFMPWGPRRTFQNGSLIKTTDDPHVYLVEDGKIYPFGGEDAFKAFGFTFDQVEDVAEDVMKKFQKQSQDIQGLDQVPASLVFKYSNAPAVYVLVSESGVLKKQHVTSMESLRSLGRADRIAVLPISKTFPDGGTASPPANQGSADDAAELASADITITVDPAKTKAISPYIYGINFNHDVTDAPSGLTLNRYGGNRWTAYNWENNASNAGSDWNYSSDSYLGGGETPAEAVRSGIAGDQSRHQASLVTFQLQGYVSADKDGSVDANKGDLADRFKKVVFKKGSAFSLTPSTSDANVYMDEFAWALNQKQSGIFTTNASYPTFVSLDNEPELWNSTHSEIQGTGMATSGDYIAKTIGLTKALKDQFPEMVIFGPVHYGFLGMYNFQDDKTESYSNDYWFTDKYLSELKKASDAYGKRLLDVYDFHWYSEAQSSDGSRVSGLTGSSLTADQVQAIVQSPRSLWDPTYTEKSWITQWMTNGPINILGKLQDKINKIWPGTKIAITEYEHGGDNHVAGAIAQADVLGIFGSQGVFAGTWWPPYGTYPYTVGAFRAYRGFDGGSANFGDVSLQASSSDIEDVSAYASTDSQKSGRTVFVVINRSTATKKVALSGQSLSGTASIYRITASSGASQIKAGKPVSPVFVSNMSVSGKVMVVEVPALSVTTIEVK